MTLIDEPRIAEHTDHDGDHGDSCDHAVDRRHIAPNETTRADRASSGRMRAAAVATGLLGASALTYVIAHDPTNGSLVPSCPLRETTGIWCPGCGLTRSVHALGNGDPMKAFRLNLFVIPIMMSFGVLYGSWVLRSFGFNVGNAGAWFAKRPWLYGGTIAVLLLFALVRNLPGMEFLIGQ